MNKSTVLVVAPVNDKQKKMLQEAAPEAFFIFSSYDGVTQSEVNEADIIFGNIKPSLIKNSERLKWLQLNSAGADPYSKPGVLDSSVILTSAVGAYGLTVSEHILAILISLFRRLPEYYCNQKEHIWKSQGSVKSIEGSTILILGLGDIGGSFARKAKALGAYTIGIRRNLNNKPAYLDEEYSLDNLDNLLPRADVVVICLPSAPETYKLFNYERLSHLKQDSVLVNIGRGNIVDCDALYKCIKSGLIYGACLDVTDPEPLPKDHPLWDCPNVIITPHVAGFFYLPSTLDKITAIVCSNLKSYFAGKKLTNLVEH